MKENKKDIKELCERFVDLNEAGQMADDICQADQLLANMSCPEFDNSILDVVKHRVRLKLQENKIRRQRSRVLFYIASAAAAIILAALAGLNNRQEKGIMPPQPIAAHIWNDNVEIDEDLTLKMENLASQIEGVRGDTTIWFEDEAGLTEQIEKLETVATDNDFWKG